MAHRSDRRGASAKGESLARRAGRRKRGRGRRAAVEVEYEWVGECGAAAEDCQGAGGGL